LFERYFTEPYRFIPPFRGTFWCGVARPLIRRKLRKNMKIVSWQFSGQEHLKKSLADGAGILLASNHCRWADPMIVGQLGRSVRQYFYYVVSYHLFKQNRFMGWFLNRIGGYSIWREGADRESIRTSARLLAEAERPVVLFPEGTWFRQNDRVGPLQDGLSLMVRQAAKRNERPIVIHPLAIKYWLLADPRAELAARLTRMESGLGWRPQEEVDLIARVEKLGDGLLTLKEIEHTGGQGRGNLDQRIRALANHLVTGLEKQYFGRVHEGWILERVRRLRQGLVRDLKQYRENPSELGRIKKHLHDLLFAENLSAHSQEYLREDPSPERLTETVERIEETLTDAVETPVASMGATVEIGPAIDVREFLANHQGNGKTSDPLVVNLRSAMQILLDRARRQGPPREWSRPRSWPYGDCKDQQHGPWSEAGFAPSAATGV
jgi:hypothetical protein